MSKQIPNTFFMFSPLTEYAGFYQELLRGISSYHSLGNRLIQLGEQAHAFRQFDKVKEIGQTLSSLPQKNYQAIGHYYLAVAANNNGNGDQEKARRLFELVANTAPSEYRAKAILSLAAVSSNTKDFQSQFRFLLEAAKASCDISTTVRAHLGIAIYKSMEGLHRQSLKDLENLYPLVRLSSPAVYFDYLNSYAVELGEAGRIEEARNVSRIVLASPLAFAYPEWQDTARDLREPNRSFVAFPFVESKFVKIETSAAQPPITETQPEPPTKVLAFPPPDSPIQPLREAPRPKKPKRVTSKELGEMDLAQKRETILAAIRSGAVPDRDYNKMMLMLGLVKSGPADHLIDLEDDAVLTELIMQWAHMVEPERIAAVMSALRDCKDDLRRSNILDSIIRKAFEYSNRCNVTESEWRLEVECKLPEK